MIVTMPRPSKGLPPESSKFHTGADPALHDGGLACRSVFLWKITHARRATGVMLVGNPSTRAGRRNFRARVQTKE
jgi:hypothetical protein